MDFILMTEGDTPVGLTHEHRYRELIEEVLLAERVGFDAFGSSEQHVALGTASVSAPEVLYPYLMALTSRIRFIHLVTLLPTRMNHALRVAERVATEDILSNGRVELYDKTLAATHHPHPITPRKMVAIAGGMHCAETTAQARTEAKPLFEMAKLSTDAYERLSKLSQDYAYIGAVKNIDFNDEEYMFEHSQGFIVGNPDHCIQHVQRYADMGADALVLRVDSLPHHQLLRSIELFGKYVIPHFKNPRNIVRSADDVLADIRPARPAHEEALRQYHANHTKETAR
ncbi:LLM class flavin-dependent oxidoreductase [Streptomyces solisilvae]|uniref:LLM class flavin-dependent oxidoreductase n=1 Tax=Streptomyces malaysiensis TaxID=92644 RepID=UPI00367F7472